jgi:hypothetical protein
VLWLAACCVSGCNDAPEFQVSTTRRVAEPRRPVDPDTLAATFDHMLTAVVPQPAANGAVREAWFLKLTAPAAKLAALRPQWDELLASLQFSEPAGKLTWRLPAGWQEQPGDAMRAATLQTQLDGQTYETTVTRLPVSGAWDEYLVSNVNRWMGQLQQTPLTAAAVLKLVERRELAGQQGAVVELRGFLPDERPSGAMAGGVGRAGGPAASAQAAAAPNPLKFTAPDGWEPGTMSMARLAAFNINDAEGAAEMTVTAFPAAPGSAMADPVANAQRWAGQVGLSNLDQKSVSELMREVQVGDQSGQRLELLGDAGDAAARGMLVAMVERAGQVYFFKLMGSRATVEAQRDKFDAFLQSVTFAN